MMTFDTKWHTALIPMSWAKQENLISPPCKFFGVHECFVLRLDNGMVFVWVCGKERQGMTVKRVVIPTAKWRWLTYAWLTWNLFVPLGMHPTEGEKFCPGTRHFFLVLKMQFWCHFDRNFLFHSPRILHKGCKTWSMTLFQEMSPHACLMPDHHLH